MSELTDVQLQRILDETPQCRKSYLVGGCVRDWLLGLPGKDVDVEVFGVGYEELAHGLSRWGRTDLVGRSFGVIKLTLADGPTYDFTIPRRDSKVASGHKGFEVTFDPEITPEEAAARRDYTINSLMYDPREKKVLDFFGGRADLEARLLRPTSEAFSEDPLRVLRGMQLAGRYGLKATGETVRAAQSILKSYRELAVERIREEWFKWAAKSILPSAGLRFLEETQWISHFPEIEALIDTLQDPEWHPEGDVFTHTCHCCDALVNLPEWRNADETSRIVYSLAVLAHDFGKPVTTNTVTKNGKERIVSPGHDKAGVEITRRFLQRINTPHAIVERVLPLVENHLAHLQANTDRAVRRLAKRLEPETIDGLCVVIHADQLGRPPKPVNLEAISFLKKKAEALNVQSRAPEPILKGRHLIQLGLKPGERFGKILDAAYDAQLEGEFADYEQAVDWLKARGFISDDR